MKSLKNLLHDQKYFLVLRDLNTLVSISNGNSTNVSKEQRIITKTHQKRKEDRYMFGPLKKNTKRTSQISTIIDSNEKNVTNNSELWWNLKINKSRMNFIHFTNNPDNTTINSIKIKKTQDITKRKIKSDEKHSDIKKDDNVETKIISNELKTPQSKNEILLDTDKIKLSRFPIFSKIKNVPRMTEKSEILSVSLKDDPEILYYPSVTKILSETMTPQAQRILRLWKERLIKEMGEEKFIEYQQELLNNGKAFHASIEDTLLKREVNIPEHILPAYNSLSSIVNELQDIRAVESFVSHKDLYYKGKVDCVATFRGKLCAIDWKKSDKDKNNLNLTYDAPIQLAAYVGAINSSKTYPFTIDCALIVVGYTMGQPADTFFLSDYQLEAYWYKWLGKVKQYWSNEKNKKNNLN